MAESYEFPQGLLSSCALPRRIGNLRSAFAARAEGDPDMDAVVHVAPAGAWTPTLSPGRPLEFDFTPRGGVSIPRRTMVRAGRIRGSVTSKHGHRLSGVRVFAIQSGWDVSPFVASDLLARLPTAIPRNSGPAGLIAVEADEDGTFVIDDLVDSGTYQVWAVGRDCVSRFGVPAVAGSAGRVGIELSPAVRVSLRTRCSKTPPRRPLVFVDGVMRPLRTGVDGRWMIEDVTPGNHELIVSTCAGPVATDIVAALEPAGSVVEIDCNPVSIAGVVLDERRNGVSGALVYAADAMRGAQLARSLMWVDAWSSGVAVTDSDGVYRVDGLWMCRHDVFVHMPGRPVGYAFDVMPESGSTEIVLDSQGRSADVRIGSVGGESLDGRTVSVRHVPIQGPDCARDDSDFVAATVAMSEVIDGRVRVEGLGPEWNLVSIHAGGFGRALVPVGPTIEGPAEVVCSKVARVTVRVTGRSGVASCATVLALEDPRREGDRRRWMHWGVTDQSGIARGRDVTIGTTFRAYCEGDRVGEVGVETADGEVSVQTDVGMWIEVTDRPSAWVTVERLDHPGRRSWELRLDEFGRGEEFVVRGAYRTSRGGREIRRIDQGAGRSDSVHPPRVGAGDQCDEKASSPDDDGR